MLISAVIKAKQTVHILAAMLRRCSWNGASYCQLLKLWSNRKPVTAGLTDCKACICRVETYRSRVSGKLWSRPLCSLGEPTEVIREQTEVTDDTYTGGAAYKQAEKNLETKFRTKENDPVKHSLEDEGLYYKLSQEDFNLYVKNGQWPSFQKQAQTFQESVLMVRRPALEAFHIIDHLNLNLPPARILFYGKLGQGKSLSLSHVVHRYAKQDWIIIQLMNVREFIRYRDHRSHKIVASEYKEGRFDYLDMAQSWLSHFTSQNKEHLQQLKATKDYEWSTREKSETGTSLFEIANFGVERKKYASDCIGAIFREVKLAASDKRVKVLVAVDDINGLWKYTSCRDDKKQRIHAQDMSIFHHFLKLFQPTWNNGVCIGSVCPSIEILDTKQDIFDAPFTPQSLLKKQGFEFMDPFIPIHVPVYTTREAFNFVEYHIDRKWIVRPRALTDAGKKELVAVSGRNPLEMMKISAML